MVGNPVGEKAIIVAVGRAIAQELVQGSSTGTTTTQVMVAGADLEETRIGTPTARRTKMQQVLTGPTTIPIPTTATPPRESEL